MLTLVKPYRATSKTANLLLLAAFGCLMLLGSGSRLFGQAPPLITEFGFGDMGNQSNGMVVADFNRDGIPDLAAVDSNDPSGFVAVYLGNGDGTFKPPVHYLPAANPNSYVVLAETFIVAADFNGDGKVDLCVADSANNLWVLPGNGDGTFQSPIFTPVTDNELTSFSLGSIAVADFNGDGKPDIVIFAIDNASPVVDVRLLLGNGDGTFGPSTEVYGPKADLDTPQQIVTSDFNGDGNADIAVELQSQVVVLLGNGAGGFSSPALYSVNGGDPVANPDAMVVADFNGDGIPDLGVGLGQLSFVEVFLGNGDGTFKQAIVTPVTGAPSWSSLLKGAMGAADFNGDGHIDLFIGSAAGSYPYNPPILLLLGNGDGTFQAPSLLSDDFPTLNPFSVAAVATADLNGDGKPDIVLSDVQNSQLVSVLNTPGTAGAAIFPAVFNFGTQVVGATAATTTVIIGNPGSSAMQFSGLAVSDTADFSATSTCGSTLAPAGNCAITVAFSPQSTGEKTASVTFTTNDPLVAPGKISVSGNAVAPAVSVSPLDLQFSYQKVGTTSPPQTVQVTNSGAGTLTLSISIQGDFQQANNCSSSLSQGASCTATITYSPSVPGSETGRLLITSNAIPAQSAVALTGIGFTVGPIVSVSPSTIDFGSQYVGTSSVASVVTVENSGDAPFNIASVAAAPGFVPLSSCGNTVGPSSSCTIGISFDPASTGSQTGTLAIAGNVSTSPQSVVLTGNGTAITVGASAASSTTQTFRNGKATYQASIAPVAGFSGTINLSCVGLPAGYNCTLSPSSAVLSGSTAASVTVTVTSSTTTAAGSQATPAPGTLGRIALACPIALIFVGAGIYPKWRRRFLVIGLLAVAATFTNSCSSFSSTNPGPSMTYAFSLQAQPASGVTIETPLTLIVPNQ